LILKEPMDIKEKQEINPQMYEHLQTNLDCMKAEKEDLATS
jgi:hypothetical protein